MKIGIIFADENEFIPFALHSERFEPIKETKYSRSSLSFKFKNNEIFALQSGVGKVNAATAAADLIFNFKVDVLLNAGLSGAVSGVRRGDIIAGETYVECDFDITPTGRSLGEKPDQKYIYPANPFLLKQALKLERVKAGAFGCGDFFLTEKEKSRLYKKLFGICAFDMESAAIASVCYFTNTPFLSVRKMSDNADDEAVSAYREMDEKQETDLTELLLKLVDKIEDKAQLA